jgi:transcriptional regulator with XRE-family HTH domain
VLPFYELKLSHVKPKDHAYPKNVKTLGDRIRARRLDLGLFQKDVASQMGVTKETIMVWEKNHHEPHLSQLPKITQFIGSEPDPPAQTMSEKLLAIRRRHGLSLDLMARYLDVDPGSLSRWEQGDPVLFKHIKHRFESFLEDYEKDGRQAENLETVWAGRGKDLVPYCPASRLPEPKTLGDHLYKRRLELGLSQSAAGAQCGVHRVAYGDYETDKWLPDHRTLPKVVKFLGFLPWPAEPHARLHLCRRALVIAAIDFERRFHISRYRLCLWETGQAEINETILNEVVKVVDRRFSASRFPRQWIEAGPSFLPARRINSKKGTTA